MSSRCKLAAVALAVAAVAAVAAAPAGAHIERNPQWVDPAPDMSIFPPAGGDFVRYRPFTDPAKRLVLFRRHARAAWFNGVNRLQRRALRDAFIRLDARQQRRALRFLARLRRQRGEGPTAKALGLVGTPSAVQSEDVHVVCRPDSAQRFRAGLRLADVTARERRTLVRKNRTLARRCAYDEIQAAVTAADNNDLVMIMPGFYTEPTSRAQPHNDPRCKDLVEHADGGSGAPTYAYQATCPNDLALIAVIGRDPQTGACIRCNLQIDGSGARPEDVIIEVAAEPKDPGVTRDAFDLSQGRVQAAKENGIRADRADGLFVRNLTVRNAHHNGVYGTEIDGMTVSRVKLFWNGEYGHLTFVTDHNTLKHSEAAGSADGGIYPGAAPATRPRINTIVAHNDVHHNVLGFSGTMGNNIHIFENDFHDNSVGISLDSFYRAGHPGFPQHATLIERNRIWSNNFDTFGSDAQVRSSVQAAVGTGMWIVGGNDNIVRDNWIWDNWRHAAMLITVPDALSNNLEYAPDPQQDAKVSTSHRNRFERNRLGVSPAGERAPNGVDYWWDELGQGNCWEGEFTSDPPRLPDCDDFPNVGLGNPPKEVELAACGFATARDENTPACDWYQQPPKPGSR